MGGNNTTDTARSNPADSSPFQKFSASGEKALPSTLNKRADTAQQSAAASAANSPIIICSPNLPQKNTRQSRVYYLQLV